VDKEYRLKPLEKGQISTGENGRFYVLSALTTTRRCAALGKYEGVGRSFRRTRERSRIELVQHTREGDGLADVFQAANPGYRAFDAHSEARMRNGTELPQIQVPFERFFRKLMLL
jgi:hypothetical protein